MLVRQTKIDSTYGALVVLDDERSGPEFRLRNLVLGAFDLVASQIGHDGALVIGKVRIPFVTAIALPFAFGQLQTQ